MTKTFDRIEIVLEPENKFDSGLATLRIRVCHGLTETSRVCFVDVDHFESLFDRVMAYGVEELRAVLKR